MAALQRVAQSSVSTSGSSSYVSCKPDGVAVSDQFPAGLRVLVVDDEAVCLRVLDHMLRRCNYHATTCSQATVALNLLRERKGCFDVVLCDVHMPDMDGFKLLEHVGLEMDLPVIMMSADATTSAVMKGIRHGACDYLIKPVREEELKNIWQHVVRKKWNQNKELDHSGSLEDSDRHKRGSDDAEYASSINEGTEGTMKPQKKRSSAKEEDDGELENEDPSATKKPRVVWSVELHQQFVSAVSQLGIDKAVPKRILELMNVPGLTRENVASHLQKFRLYLKRLSGMGQQGGISSTLCGNIESNIKLASLGRYEIQALAASGQIPPQTLAALHAELLGQPAGNLVTAVDQPALLQASLLGRKYIPVEPGFAFSQPLVKCQSNMSKHFHQSIISAEDATSGFGAWPSNNLGAVGPGSNLGGLSSHNSNVLMDILHQQQQQQQKQQQQQSTPSEPSRTINVQPSCLVVPSQSTGFQAGNSPTSVNQNCNFSRAAGMDYSLLSSQSNTSLSIGEISDVDIKNSGVLSGYSVPGSISPSASCCSVNADNSTCQQVQNSTAFGPSAKLPELLPNVCGFQSSCDTKSGEAIDQKLLRNLGFVGKGTCIPSRFAVDELESPINNLNHGKAFMECNVNKMKQEPSMEFMDNTEVDRRVLQQFPPNDLMSVFTE